MSMGRLRCWRKQTVLDLAETEALGVVDEAVQPALGHGLGNVGDPGKDIVGVSIP